VANGRLGDGGCAVRDIAANVAKPMAAEVRLVHFLGSTPVKKVFASPSVKFIFWFNSVQSKSRPAGIRILVF
jgi:hypothetical protein